MVSARTRHALVCVVGVATACELGAAPFDRPFGLADEDVRTAKPALDAVAATSSAATADNRLTGVAVADSRLDPSRPCSTATPSRTENASRGWSTDAGGLDQLFGPGDRFVSFDETAEQPRVRGDGGGDVEVTVVGGPPERGAQIGQLGGEPVVRLPLAGAVPQRHDVGFAPGEVAGMRGPDLSRPSPPATSCSSANWRIVSSIENRVRPDDRSATSSDLRTSASSRSRMA